MQEIEKTSPVTTQENKNNNTINISPTESLVKVLSLDVDKIRSFYPNVNIYSFLSSAIDTYRKLDIKQYPDLKNQFKACLYEIAEMNLLPSTIHNYVWLIPYGGKLELQVGIKGFVELASRQGFIVISNVVYKNDFIDIDLANMKIEHKVSFDKGEAIGVYALIKTKDNQILQIEIITYDEIENIRKISSKAPNSPSWKNYWGEMARKVAIKRLLKKPIANFENTQITKAINIDNEQNFISYTNNKEKPINIEVLNDFNPDDMEI